MRYTRNDRTEARNALFGDVSGTRPRGNFLIRKNDGVTFDHVYTMSPASLFNLRAGWQRFDEPNIRQHEGSFDPTSLGFSQSTNALFGGARYFPLFDFASLSDIGDNLGGTTLPQHLLGATDVHAGSGAVIRFAPVTTCVSTVSAR